MKTRKISISVIACISMMPFAAMASATWNMGAVTSPTCVQTTTGSTVNGVGNVGNTWTCTSVSSTPGGETPTMTATAWSNTGSGSTFAAAKLARYTWTAPNPDVYDYGVVNSTNTETTTNNQHSMDNVSNTDLILLNFSKEISLSSVSLGWTNTDADISVLRYTGSGAPNLNTNNVSGLGAGGWELIGHYADLQNDLAAPAKTAEITNAGTSSWWIISAYNASYGTATTAHGGSSTGLNAGNDYVKLLQVAGTVPTDSKTPEPGSMMLLGIGLVGLMGLRRRRQDLV